MIARRRARIARLRRRVHFILDSGVNDRAARFAHGFLIALVGVSVAAVVLETVPSLRERYQILFDAIELVALIGFSIEYALRLWSAPDSAPFFGMTPWRARLAYARSPYAIVDLLTVLPFYLGLFLPGDFRVLLLLRLARFFKLARYSPGMRSLAAALKAERKALGASAVIIFGVVLVMASAMHIAEHAAQPDKFGSIPESMWWAVVTITTVGYGDVVPVTVIGKMIAGVTAFMGFLLLALPVGIVATAFAEEIHRREFVVTWSMIAHVPLFATLDASEIAEIMHYLRAQTVPAGTIVVRRGEEAHCMYFVAAGEVEVELPHNAVRLGEGQFFGEIAVMRKTRRTATVRTTLPSKLLVLDAGDLGTLMARNPEIGRRIEEAIAAYGEIPALAPRGDMAADEVGQPTGDS
ncbi:MAG: ion transporter [Rhodoblastus sp.]|nr:ion transporter [Rhodoblastus sp.]MCB9998965.1 ion transporter [Methylobacteriaceae bacterium]MCC0002236.1 ion transporter [Methylobacteriaceae bacterium]MCO5087525.1 cyclic nucleotide-gated ion channel/potassium channel family protein [Methylobacteriaceae bacterium]HPG04400.1 cyclic nucleotide-gated ion channel [Rhodoblastus sp.]